MQHHEHLNETTVLIYSPLDASTASASEPQHPGNFGMQSSLRSKTSVMRPAGHLPGPKRCGNEIWRPCDHIIDISRLNMLSRHRLRASIFGFKYRSEMIWWNITSEISMYREISNNPAQTLKTLIWHEILSAQFDGLSRPSQKLWNKDPSIEKAWRSLSQVSGSEKKWNLSTKTTGVPQSYFSGERRLRMIPMLWPSTFCMISIHPQPKTSYPIHIRWDPVIHRRRCDALQTCILHPNWQLNTPWSMRMVAQFAKCADIRTPVNQCQSTKITMTCITKK